MIIKMNIWNNMIYSHLFYHVQKTYLNGTIYTEMYDKRYIIHPSKSKIIREQKPPKTLKSQYRVQQEIKIRKHQKVN